MQVDEHLHHFMHITFIGFIIMLAATSACALPGLFCLSFFMYFKVVVVILLLIIIMSSSTSSSRINICGWGRH